MVSEVYNMDCVEYMRTQSDNHFDIAICDPPYGDADSGNFYLGGGGLEAGSTATNSRLRFHGGDRWNRYKKPQIAPPISNNKPTGIHTQGGTWATKYRKPSITPTEADSAAIRGVQTDSKLQRIDWDVAPPQEFFDEWNDEFHFTLDPAANEENHKCETFFTNGNTVVMLLPARTDTRWFHEFIYGKDEIRFVRGRLKFGNATNSAPFPIMVVVWRGD